ncbi:MAG TPA: hypothetical protein VLB74_03885 [Flavobacterium sp.]|uniref:hypothetical protein n=1 Tax=Flavobacterium sp. TaxID=239 RepID=UPI002C986FE3|nr:hypothetical protein [Flavobacterium sp.]HSD13766.1 hypothetical protein [Flavobacterium sp.]
MRKNVSVILTGSASLENLEKVLLGYNAQNYRNFEVLLMLNASDNDKLKLPDTLLKELFFPISKIVIASAILTPELFSKTSTEYFLFAGLSAIPRYDFVEQHMKYREEGYFLSGSTIPVKETVSRHIVRETLDSGVCFDPKWLKQHNSKSQFSNLFRFSEGLQATLWNRILCGNTTFHFDNASAWRNDLESISVKSGTDKDITKLLVELGCKPKQIKFSTVLLETEAVSEP